LTLVVSAAFAGLWELAFVAGVVVNPVANFVYTLHGSEFEDLGDVHGLKTQKKISPEAPYSKKKPTLLVPTFFVPT
jgi:hypothetical protein